MNIEGSSFGSTPFARSWQSDDNGCDDNGFTNQYQSHEYRQCNTQDAFGNDQNGNQMNFHSNFQSNLQNGFQHGFQNGFQSGFQNGSFSSQENLVSMNSTPSYAQHRRKVCTVSVVRWLTVCGFLVPFAYSFLHVVCDFLSLTQFATHTTLNYRGPTMNSKTT